MASNISINLPKGWIKTRVEEVCRTKSGGTPSRKNPDYFGGKIPWIKSGELNDSVIYSCEETITKLGLEKSNAVLYPKNTVLLAMYGATIGKISIFGISASTNQAICTFYHNEKIITNLYLFWFLKSIRRNLVNIGFGGAQKNISQEKIKPIWIPLPPLNEQKRIVIKIESIFAQIDAAKQQLERLASQVTSSSGNLAQLKSSVLKQAFKGKLVPQDPPDESAKSFLKRIHKDYANGLFFEKDDLPKGWIRISLENITKNHDGKRIPISAKLRKEMHGTYPYYGASGIIDYVNKPIFNGKYLLIGEDGANLLSRTTPIAFIAYGEFWVNNHAHVLTTLDNISLEFLSYFINSIDLSNWVTGTAQPKLTQSNMKKIPVSIPSLNEQKRIVTKIESIFGNIDTLNLFCFILRGNLFTNIRYFMILYMQHVISEQ